LAPLVLLSLVATTLLYGCIDPEETGKIGVVVTLPPQKEMIEAIGGDMVKVTVMVPAGENPHSYAPTPSQMVDLARAELYLKVGSGVEFELTYLDEIASQNENLAIVDCSLDIVLIDAEDHHHGKGDSDDSHLGKDPHYWLSPANAKTMVRNICDGLVSLDPANRDLYETNRDAYLERLDQLDAEIRGILHDLENREILVYHPAWAYFAEAYGLVELPVEEEGKQPGPADVAGVVDQAREHGIKVIFVSPQFDQTSAKTIAQEIGGRVLTLNPLPEDYVENLRDVALKVGEGLGG
jgi:zinc transport system substrate-binding protein